MTSLEKTSKLQDALKVFEIGIRSIWEHEANQFTPWLAEPKNLNALGEALQIDLELEAQEVQVGPFRADILAKNTADETLVLVENQMGKTDHKHLGQVLTYAAGLKASTVVWLATSFSEEHKAALDWLNSFSNDSVRFFGVVIELWRIGNSFPAPQFHVVCQPNEWGKSIQKEATALAQASGLDQLRLRYWAAFRTHLLEHNSRLRPPKPVAAHRYIFGIGTGLARLVAVMNTKDSKIAVELELLTESAKAAYEDLFKEKANIEASIGMALDWRDLPDTKGCRIILSNPKDPYTEDEWPQQFAWLQEHLEKFEQAFRPLLANKAFTRREEEV